MMLPIPSPRVRSFLTDRPGYVLTALTLGVALTGAVLLRASHTCQGTIPDPSAEMMVETQCGLPEMARLMEATGGEDPAYAVSAINWVSDVLRQAGIQSTGANGSFGGTYVAVEAGRQDEAKRLILAHPDYARYRKWLDACGLKFVTP